MKTLSKYKFPMFRCCFVWFVTARNEVGARLCFYTCLWFCLQGRGSAPLHGGINPPPPGPEAGTPLGPGTPPDQALPSTVHAGRYGQQAGGTHPTGMQSCWRINSFTAWVSYTESKLGSDRAISILHTTNQLKLNWNVYLLTEKWQSK